MIGTDEVWQSQVKSTVTAVAGPMLTDGGSFSVESCDRAANRVLVTYSLPECDDCAIPHDGLHGLIEEALHRAVDPELVLDLVAAA